MLQHFTVKNYALIEHLELDWNAGFTAITGETGAGKSILLGALGLIIGNRADTSVAKNPEKKVVVEATFAAQSNRFQSFFKKHDLDPENTGVARREISSSGKSRAFINDTPVTLAVLKELGSLLVDIHAQHQNLLIQDTDFQLHVLNSISSIEKELGEYQLEFKAWKTALKKLRQIEENQAQLQKDQDYIQFQFDELEKAELQTGELDDLESELKVLEHAEEIKSALFQAGGILSESEQNSLVQLQEVQRLLKGISNFNINYQEMYERISSSLIELQDLAAEIVESSENTPYDPERQQYVSERVDLIHKLLSKHQVQNIDELLEIQQQLSDQLLSVDQNSEALDGLKAQINKHEESLKSQSIKISAKRKKHIPELEKEMQFLLMELGMENATFKVQLSETPNFTLQGKDEVQFLFSANKGVKPDVLTKVGSGGELSRCMLALKLIMSRETALPSIIFDEIDTGVSGKVASKLAGLLNEMSKQMQVICITHLPQVAGKASDHLKVMKQETGESTISTIVRLDNNQRVEELAHMLSGEVVSDAALNNARELLQV